MKVLHLITGLEVGGAEMMLFNLLMLPTFTKETSRVVSLTSIGPIGHRIQKLGIEVTALGMKPGHPDIKGLIQFTRLLRKDPPDLIQSWMYHADLLGSLSGLFAGNIPIVWGVHHTLDGEKPVQKSTMQVLRLNAFLSRWLPKWVICCAESARQAHIRVGYYPQKMIVIPNGIDINSFSPNPEARSQVRGELGIDSHTPLIGLFARFHPQKDHQTFARAAGLLQRIVPNVHFLLAGTNITPENKVLLQWLQEEGALEQSHLLGLRNDMPRLMAAVDITCLSSAFGEALPLAIVESMACGIPCVVTNVGDAGMLVGDTGRVVPPGNPRALSDAWRQIIELQPLDRQTLGNRARLKISLEYNIHQVSERYLSLYRSILPGGETHG